MVTQMGGAVSSGQQNVNVRQAESNRIKGFTKFYSFDSDCYE